MMGQTLLFVSLSPAPDCRLWGWQRQEDLVSWQQDQLSTEAPLHENLLFTHEIRVTSAVANFT